VEVMAVWVDSPQDPHLLRLMAHLVLINKSLGVAGEADGEEKVVRAYTEYLMAQDKLALVPWYVSRLAENFQCPLFASFLRGIKDHEDQRLCLYLGREVGLDMQSIIVTTVELAREGDPQEMVASLKWLGHDTEIQAGDLLIQANCVMRRLLLAGETEHARAGANMVPNSVLEQASREWKGESGILPGVAVREHIALQTYLTAMEAFNDWFDHFHKGQPRKPVLAEGASFTERVAHEQREKQYEGEMERWRGGQMVQSRQGEDKIRAVLTFPGGWLVDEDAVGDETMDTKEESEDQRQEELCSLRRLVLPRTVILLHSLLHSTGQYAKGVALADIVADERHALHLAFTKDGLKDLLQEVRESALASMEQGRDAWGYNKQ